ncbi:MAG: response regulator [Rhodospirillales bacterium]
MADKAYNLEKLNFLVVDDNKHMRVLVRTILNTLGVRNVTEADDGAGAFKELQHFHADIVICDWNMDPFDGLDFTRMVRTASDSPNPFVPIIMLTGHTETHRVMEARDAGIHEYIAKPISPKSLYSRIRAIIERPREFVRVKGALGYFGPDRRRHRAHGYLGADRRKSDKGADAMEMNNGLEPREGMGAMLNG